MRNPHCVDFRRQVRDTFGFARSLVSSVTESISSGLSRAFVGAIVEAKNLGQAFREWGRQTLQMISQMIVKMLIMKTLSSVLGSFGFGFNQGGPVLGLNDGGMIPGRGPDVDTVPAMLTRGEYVIPRSSVDHYGIGVMEAIRRRLMPKPLAIPATATAGLIGRNYFNSGGEVGSGNNGTQVQQVILADEQTMETLINGGKPVLKRHLREWGVQVS